MAEDLGTVNIKGARLGREIEVMRQRYQEHRDALEQLAVEAPTEALAREYRRLQTSIDDSLSKLTELERGGGAQSEESDAVVANARRNTAAGDRAISHPIGESGWRDNPPAAAVGTPVAPSRALLIALGGLAVLVILGFLVWRSSTSRPTDRAAGRATNAPGSARATSDTLAPLVDPEPAAPVSTLTVNPATADYGTIRKGTRAVRQFELRNSGPAPIQVKVNRSSCRCLYYDYVETVPAKGKETLTITVDGARAKSGTLDQSVQIVTKSDGSSLGIAGVHATIK